MKVSWYYYR